MAKDEEKQKQIREKTKSDAVSENARAIGQTNTTLSTSGTPPQQPVPALKTSTGPPSSKPAQPVATKPLIKSDAPIKRSNLFIQAIPPFKGKPSNPPLTDGNASNAVNRLNVNASSFKPNPQAIAFTPVRSPVYALCTFTDLSDHRVFPQPLRAAHRLPTNPQNQNPQNLRSQIRSLESRSRRQPLFTSKTTSIPSSMQRLLKLLPSVCPTSGSIFQ